MWTDEKSEKVNAVTMHIMILKEVNAFYSSYQTM